jgi:hypothetical protein
MHEPTAIVVQQRRCTHTRPSGSTCGSYAIRGEQFCFHHHPSRPPARRSRPDNPRAAFGLPAIMNRRSIQIAISDLTLRIADNTVDTKRAGLLLQCLQIAAATHTI